MRARSLFVRTIPNPSQAGSRVLRAPPKTESIGFRRERAPHQATPEVAPRRADTSTAAQAIVCIRSFLCAQIETNNVVARRTVVRAAPRMYERHTIEALSCRQTCTFLDRRAYEQAPACNRTVP